MKIGNRGTTTKIADAQAGCELRLRLRGIGYNRVVRGEMINWGKAAKTRWVLRMYRI
jgi:hypothetical protein